jgi:hypothetical protein
MTTNAIPLFPGMLEKNCSSASRPPADAPMPTIGKEVLLVSSAFGTGEGLWCEEGCAGRSDCSGVTSDAAVCVLFLVIGEVSFAPWPFLYYPDKKQKPLGDLPNGGFSKEKESLPELQGESYKFKVMLKDQ